RAGFPQIRGVEVGTRVRVLGRDAGEVVAVDLPAHPSGEVVLRLRLDGRLRSLIRADASAQIAADGMMGGKIVDITPGTDHAEPVAYDSRIASKPCAEVADLLAQVGSALGGIGSGKGSLGKLVNDDQAYEELVRLLRSGQGTMTALKQNADALKGMPVVRS